MGLLMEFRIGEAKAMATAFQSLDFEKLEAFSRGLADFSLHLSPDDLDALVEALCRSCGHEPVRFLEVMSGPIAGDREERGVFLVSHGYVKMAAAIPEDCASEITERWMSRVADECGDPEITATAESVLAVSELLRICREAARSGLDMVYCWSL